MGQQAGKTMFLTLIKEANPITEEKAEWGWLPFTYAREAQIKNLLIIARCFVPEAQETVTRLEIRHDYIVGHAIIAKLAKFSDNAEIYPGPYQYPLTIPISEVW